MFQKLPKYEEEKNVAKNWKLTVESGICQQMSQNKQRKGKKILILVKTWWRLSNYQCAGMKTKACSWAT